MFTNNAIPFELPGFQIDAIEENQDSLIITAHATTNDAICPGCGHLTRRVHSYYTRSPRDWPANDRIVRLRLHVRRFRCLNEFCSQKTFAERLPEIVATYAQRTIRLTTLLRQLGFALGGEAGARLVRHLRIETSADTLLRIIRQTGLSSSPTPRVLGVDDWALRKGHSYGTILVDLERHKPVDLLPDREANTLASWLQNHPGVSIVARDRSGEYAAGVTQGAPDALQVADRWHLFKNLSDVLTDILDLHRRKLKQISRSGDWSAHLQKIVDVAAIQPMTTPTSPQAAERSRIRHEQRYQRYQEVCQCHQRGLTFTAIAQQVGLHPKTVRRWVRAGQFPERQPRTWPSKLDAYKPFLLQRWNEGCWTAAQLYREIRDQGYQGKRTRVTDFVRQMRHAQGLAPGNRSLTTALQTVADHRQLTPRRGAYLILCRPDQMENQDHELVKRIRQLHPDVATAIDLIQEFARMIRDQLPDTLGDWLTRAGQSIFSALSRFARGVQQDLAAVKAAMTEPWSSGQTEGQVNRLKCIKRQMYGRAKFDLLRLRVLYPT